MTTQFHSNVQRTENRDSKRYLFTAALSTKAKRQKQPKCPSMDERRDKTQSREFLLWHSGNESN